MIFTQNSPPPSFVRLVDKVVFAVFCVISVLGRVGPSVLHVGQGGLRWAIVPVVGHFGSMLEPSWAVMGGNFVIIIYF